MEENKVNTITRGKIPILTFIVKDYKSNLLEGVSMIWNGNSYTTGADGKINIMSGEGGTYAFSKEGYTSSSQSLDAITVDSTHSIVLSKIYTIIFNIQDTNVIALKNVRVTFGTTMHAAYSPGVVSFLLSKGPYSHSSVYSHHSILIVVCVPVSVFAPQFCL